MKRSHGLLAVSGLAAAIVFAGCSDDPKPTNGGTAGTGTGGAAGTATAGSSTTAGTPAAGSFGTAGTAGTDVGGTGGVTGGTGGTPAAGTGGIAPTAGTGGTAPAIVPTVFFLDNVRLQLAATDGGAGGEGGAPEVGGAPGSDAGGMGGMGGEGGANVDPPAPVQAPAPPAPGFLLTFDTAVAPLTLHGEGFSPGPGGSTGPAITNATFLTFAADGGYPGGAAKVSVPFTVAKQQADFAGTFATPADLTGYELTADVKMSETGDVGTCATVWLYVYGGLGYANDKSGEPVMLTTSHLVKNKWTKVRLNLNGPYGAHSTETFAPTNVTVWGAQFNTWGCP
jgi:hypothetical protein